MCRGTRTDGRRTLILNPSENAEGKGQFNLMVVDAARKTVTHDFEVNFGGDLR